MYAITGITGQVGDAVARKLLAEGANVRAVARDTRRAAPWVERGCELAIAEMSDAPALVRGFAGADGVFVLIPPIFDPSPGFAEAGAVISAVRDALAKTRPARTVCLSTVGAQARQPNLLNQLAMMERELGTLDLPIAFIRAAWFMENAIWDVPSAREGAIQSFLRPLDHAIPMVATADIGTTAARLLQERWVGRRVVELQGPAPVSPNELATVLGGQLGRSVRAHVVPREEWEALFRTQGMRNPTPRMQMLDGFNQGWLSFEDGEDVEAVTGTTTLEMVVR
ncbi:MAG: NmrA family NAD(P)-binding protein, partial [Acetobacteraceae bacterium]